MNKMDGLEHLRNSEEFISSMNGGASDDVLKAVKDNYELLKISIF